MTVLAGAEPLAEDAVIGKTRRERSRPRGSAVGSIRVPWWFLAPAVLLYALVVLFPNVQGAIYSFTDWNGFRPDVAFVGLQNFAAVFSNENTVRAIFNTFTLTFIVAVAQNLIGFLLAMGLNTQVKSRYVLRLLFFLPVVLTPIVAGYLWKYLLTPNGTVNSVLEAIGLGALKQNWLGDPTLALYSVCAVIVWQGAGYTMVIYLAGLQAVPEEILEAAAIDGAGPIRRTWSVTLPLINGAIVVNFLLCVLGNLKQFDTVWSMTSGGPAGATETLGTIVYKTAFLYMQYPQALAQGVVLTIIVGVIGFVQYRLTQRQALS